MAKSPGDQSAKEGDSGGGRPRPRPQRGRRRADQSFAASHTKPSEKGSAQKGGGKKNKSVGTHKKKADGAAGRGKSGSRKDKKGRGRRDKSQRGGKAKDNRPPKKDASFGVVPVYLAQGERQYLLIQHLGGHWGFPKGHPENDETPEESARRELLEETGLECRLMEGPAMVESYNFRQRGGRRVEKTVTYFIGYVESQNVTLQEEEVIGAFWGNAEQTRQQLTFDEGRRLLSVAETFLREQEHAARVSGEITQQPDQKGNEAE